MLLIPGLFLLLIILQVLSSENLLGDSILRSFLVVSGLTWIITELLSLFNFITYNGIFFSWLSLVLIAITLIIWSAIKNPGLLKEKIKHLADKTTRLTWQDWVLVSLISIILVLTLIIALFSPPNTFDSMTYHMARVVHWIQNQSVEFYPTSIPRQNHSMPFAEYLILNIQVLVQTDKYANLVQWTGFGILMVVVSMTANQFRVSRTGRLFAALAVATLPMAILQSSSTQNDIITSVFCVSFAYYLLKVIRNGSWIDVIFGGLSFGLALLTKGTAYIYCAAIGLPVAIAGLVIRRKKDPKRLVGLLAVIVLGGLVINSGFYIRNIDLYSHPLSTETDRITIDSLSIKALYSNLIRNGFVHLALPFPKLNREITSLLDNHLSGINTGQESLFEGTEFKIQYLINEDESGNFLHFILITISLVLLLCSWNKNDRYINIVALSVIFSIMLFSGLLKWQPWGTRLQLPIFSLGIPIIVYAVDRFRKPSTIILVLSVGLSIFSLPYLFLNNTRPLVPLFSADSNLRSNKVKRFFSNRPDLYQEYKEIIAPFYQDSSILHANRLRMYFSSNKRLYQDYLSVMAAVNELDEEFLGLHLGGNDWEYPIWVMADRLDTDGTPGFIHIGVENESRILERNFDYLPKYVLSTDYLHLSEIMANPYEILVDTKSIDLLVNSAGPE